MTDTITTNLIASGMLAGIAVLALKTGLGCGFANLKRKEVVYFASVYLVVSIIMGYFVGIVPLDLTQNILAMGVTMHLIIAAGLIYFGVRTKKEWLSEGRDLSRKTFLLLSLPCPVCLTATFLTCTVLAAAIDRSNIVIGGIVGLVFFAGIIAASFSVALLARRFDCKDPSALGTTMILFGLFYLLSPLIIPAYLQAQTVQTPGIPVDPGEIALSFALMAALASLGFARDRYKRSNG
ncbi:MAG TPA: transporter [Methanosarcinales archaeon]|nr:transporter [Methanosarcinales archaeon]